MDDGSDLSAPRSGPYFQHDDRLGGGGGGGRFGGGSSWNRDRDDRGGSGFGARREKSPADGKWKNDLFGKDVPPEHQLEERPREQRPPLDRSMTDRERNGGNDRNFGGRPFGDGPRADDRSSWRRDDRRGGMHSDQMDRPVRDRLGGGAAGNMRLERALGEGSRYERERGGERGEGRRRESAPSIAPKHDEDDERLSKRRERFREEPREERKEPKAEKEEADPTAVL